ncbi:unnamed protein product [Adineta ricciae]|uniref:UNC93-like protein n=1 Tax=Adineta ricciae TaxID=249248 RepID=A0A815SVH7_ADIRI|nr:unnamed protein product [Adineta ricciae]
MDDFVSNELGSIYNDEENRRKTSFVTDSIPVHSHSSITSVDPTIINDATNTSINEKDEVPILSIRQIYKNLAVLSIAFVLLFTAYSGIAALQSSLNTKGNVGINSLLVNTIFIAFGSIFLTGISIDIFGLKWTILIGEITYISYIAANVRPTPTLMYTTATVCGLVSAPLWTSKVAYVNCIARYHARHTQKKAELIISLFFGIFFAVFSMSTIWGNAVSYFVLNNSNNPQRVNCGIYFNPLTKNGTEKHSDIDDTKRYILCGIYAGMGVVSVLLLFFFLDQIHSTERQPIKQSLKKTFEVLRSLVQWRFLDQLLLVPITMWAMIEHTFLTAQFTRAFITCLVGIRFIGLILIGNGICTALSSYIFGRLVKCIGRIGCILIAATIDYSMIIFMYFWEPKDNQMYILFIVAGLWGVADAVWQSQIIATYIVLHSERDPTVLAKYRLWKAIGSLVTYSYASYATIEATLFILFSFLTISLLITLVCCSCSNDSLSTYRNLDTYYTTNSDDVNSSSSIGITESSTKLNEISFTTDVTVSIGSVTVESNPASAIVLPIVLVAQQSSPNTSASTFEITVITASLTFVSTSTEATTKTTVNCVYPFEQTPSGQCVNILIDFNNCGAVGYVCPSNYTSCSAGECSSAPNVVLTNAIPIFTAALNGSIDDVYYNVTLPLNITLYSTTTNFVQVSTNGVLCLNNCSTIYTETALPSSNFSGATAFPYWDDLYVYANTSQGIYYEVQGNTPNRTVIFEYYCSHYRQPEEYYHFQVVFFEQKPGVVKYIYYDVSDRGISCTIGIQASCVGPFMQHAFHQMNSVVPNMTLTYDTNKGVFDLSSIS